LLLAVCVVAAASAIAQDVSFQAGVDKNPVGVGEEFSLSLSLKNAGMSGGKNLKFPDLSAFRILSGPNQSTSMQFVNGAMSSSVTYTYMLQAKDVGKVTIGAATIEAGGKTLQTQPVVLEVVKAAPKPKQQGQQADDLSGQIGDNVFLKAVVNRNHVMQGEQINVTFKLYTRLSVLNYAVDKTPNMTGFWGEDIETPKDIQLTTEMVNGKQYRVGVVKKMALFPTQSGTLEISPMTVQTQLQVPAPRSVDPFDAFFRDPFGRTTNFAAHSEALKIIVDPLPSGAPAEFKGAVGQLAMTANADKKTTKTNEPVSLKITISGTGNIKLLEAPTLDLPPDFEQYSPKVSENINRQNEKIGGSKTFEYLLIPRYPGMKTVKPVTFAFFDPAKKKYIELSSPELSLNVEQGASAPPNLAGANVREDVRTLTQDIRFIKVRNSEFQQPDEFTYNSAFFIALVFLPLAGFGGAYVLTSKLRADRADAVGYRNRRAIKVAKKRLRTAEGFLKSSSDGAGAPTQVGPKFYSEISGALWQYLGDKLGIAQADYAIDSAIERLLARGANESIVKALRSLLESCDMARFAPTTIDRSGMQRAYDEASRIIVELEKSLRAR
jgi:hypothetical protein